MSIFPPMWKVIPEKVVGTAEVRHVVVSEGQSRLTSLQGYREYVPAGKYAQLLINGNLIMSDTRYEHITNREVVSRAHGHVLVAGLGLGMVIAAICSKPEVGEVVVVENNPDVITAIESSLRRWLKGRGKSRLRIFKGDIFDSRKVVGPLGPFDCIWFDVWGNVSTDTLDEMTTLTRRYRALRRSKESFMECWDREYLRYRKRIRF